MTDAEGTYSKLVEIASEKAKSKQAPPPLPAVERPPAEPQSQDDLTITPYISQNYRFTEDEIRWLRRQAYSLTEKLGGKVSQNTVLRIALRFLRDACARNPKRNPLLEAASRLKK